MSPYRAKSISSNCVTSVLQLPEVATLYWGDVCIRVFRTGYDDWSKWVAEMREVHDDADAIDTVVLFRSMTRDLAVAVATDWAKRDGLVFQ